MIKPHICIIILNWNGYEVTRECLLSLKNISYRNYTIVLVDNGSVDNSIDKLSPEFNQIDYLELDKNYGFTGGNNKGIEYAKKKYNPDYFLLLNNDTEVTPNFLDNLIKPFFSSKNVYAAVPKIYYFDRRNVIWCAGGEVRILTGNVKEYGKNRKDSDKTSVQRKVGFMNGCAALLSNKAIQEIGLLDDMFFAYSEDSDYSLRILKSGHSIVYVPSSVIYHKVSQTFKSNSNNWFKNYLATRNIVLLQRKHLHKMVFPIFVLWFLFRWVIYVSAKVILKGQFKNATMITRGFLDGLTNTKRYNL